MNLFKTTSNQILPRLYGELVAVNILINLIQPCNQLVDTILTGQAYGPEALQIYALFLPVNAFLVAVGAVFSKGTQITCSHLIGKGKVKEAGASVASAFMMAFVLSLLMTVGILLFSDNVAIALGAGGSANQVSQMSGYLKAYAIGIPAIFLLDILMCLMQLEGKRGVIVFVSLCVFFINALGNLTNIYLLQWGIMGMALATSLSYIISLILILVIFLKNPGMLRPSMDGAGIDPATQILKNGFPSLTYYGSLVIRSMVMNMIVLTFLDRGDLVSLLVVNQFATLTDVMIGGQGEAVLLLGGVLHGEKDERGLAALLKLSSVSSALLMGMVTALTMIFSPFLARLFIDATATAYVDMAARALMITAVYLVPDVLQCVLKKYIQAIGHALFTSVTNVLTNVVYCCGFAWLFSVFWGSDGLFLSFTAAYGMALITNVIFVTWVSVNRGKPQNEKYFVFHIDSPEGCVSVSKAVYDDCDGLHIDQRRRYLISLFVEEMTKNIVENGFQPGKKNKIIVKIMLSEERITINIKDTCRHFDPTRYYEKIREDADIDSGFGIRMLMALSKNVVYTNSFNLNNLLIEI